MWSRRNINFKGDGVEIQSPIKKRQSLRTLLNAYKTEKHVTTLADLSKPVRAYYFDAATIPSPFPDLEDITNFINRGKNVWLDIFAIDLEAAKTILEDCIVAEGLSELLDSWGETPGIKNVIRDTYQVVQLFDCEIIKNDNLIPNISVSPIFVVLADSLIVTIHKARCVSQNLLETCSFAVFKQLKGTPSALFGDLVDCLITSLQSALLELATLFSLTMSSSPLEVFLLV